MKLKNLFKNPEKIIPIDKGRSQLKLNRQTYIIHHYCPHTYNIGDHFVIKSIRTYLKKYLPQATFVPKASAGNRGWGKPVRLRGQNINESNLYADAVIVGGSDQYNNWDLRIRKEEIVKLNPPLFLIGLGVSSKSISDPPFIGTDSFYEDIRVTNQQAQLSSVRDHFTQRFLESLGYSESVVTGCPAMFLFDKPFHLEKQGHIALTFPFPVMRSRDHQLYQHLTALISDLLAICQKNGFRTIISCHDDRDIAIAQAIFPNEELFFSNYVDDFIDFYSQSALVIGSRLHASIFVSGLGKPFININLDARGKGFSETFDLENWNLNIDDQDLMTSIRQRLLTILSGDLSLFHRFYHIKAKYKIIYENFMKTVAERISARY